MQSLGKPYIDGSAIQLWLRILGAFPNIRSVAELKTLHAMLPSGQQPPTLPYTQFLVHRALHGLYTNNIHSSGRFAEAVPVHPDPEVRANIL